jgi:hypothetical protein
LAIGSYICLFSAEQNDYQLIEELKALLSRPYDEGTALEQDRWFIRTQSIAQNLPGVTFLSCSS